MSSYIDKFNDIAQAQPKTKYSYWFTASEEIDSTSLAATGIIKKSLEILVIAPDQMIGQCFSMINGASMALLSEGIKHTVTVGDVLLDGKSYFGVSQASVFKEIKRGYIADEPANAHAWITLENGDVIDLTILPSIAYHRSDIYPRLEKIIYTPENKKKIDITHVPYSLGLEYIIKATTPPGILGWVANKIWERKFRTILKASQMNF